MKEAAQNESGVRWVHYPLILLIALYAPAALLPSMWPGAPPLLAVATQILIPALFVLIHGWRVYSLRGILVFLAITLVVGNIFENLGTRTGLPFGSYYFTDIMGPKLLGIPLLMGPAYLAIGYTSWMISYLILRPAPRLFATPLLATVIAVTWDLSADPTWSTVSHFWIWRHGGPYFGVPIMNFFGWFLTNYVIFQLFALYDLRRSSTNWVSLGHWYLGLASYLMVIAVSLGRSAALFSHAHIADATGRHWSIGVLALASALVSLFLMGGFGALAFWKLARQPAGEIGESATELTQQTVAN